MAGEKASSARLIRYLAAKNKPLRILEVGCGNGWLSHRLSLIHGVQVTGQDINVTELTQAARVFGDASNIRFIAGDLHSQEFLDLEVDVIVFAASIQYFPSLENTLRWSLQRLGPGGEIHILDSPFYELGEVSEARKRTLDHFNALGFPEMAEYNPRSITGRILHRKDPFPWYSIKK